MLKNFVASVSIFALSVMGVAPAAAQTPLSGVLETLEQQSVANEELTATLEGIASLLATQVALTEGDRRAQRYTAGAEGTEGAREAAGELTPRVEGAVDFISDPSNQAALDRAIGPDLRERLQVCLSGASEEWQRLIDAGDTNSMGDINAAIEACSPESIRSILGELEVQQDRALEAWRSCHAALADVEGLSLRGIPTDPTALLRGDISDDVTERLAALREQAEGAGSTARECAGQLEDLFVDIQNQENAAAAAATFANFAATACMGSGGNPWVCGGLFAIAILMALFGGGSGDGDGDGKSDGTGQMADGSNVGDTGPSPTPPVDPDVIQSAGCSQDESQCVQCRRSSPTAMTCELAGDDAVFDYTVLASEDGRVDVADVEADPDRAPFFSLIRDIITQRATPDFAVCGPAGSGRPSVGLVVNDNGQAVLFGTFMTEATLREPEMFALEIPDRSDGPVGPSLSAPCP